MQLILWLVVGWTSVFAQTQNKLDYHYLRAQVGIGFKHMCIISKGKVRCWQGGRDPEIQRLIEMPMPVANPLQIAAGDKHTCVLDGEDVHCNHVYKTWTQPKLKRVREIAAIENVACALDQEGMKCWGEDERSQKFLIGGLKKPRLLTAGGYLVPEREAWRTQYTSVCVVDGDELHCQGNVTKGKVALKRSLKNPRYIAVGISRVCVLDDLGIICNKDFPAEADFKPSDNFQQVENEPHACQFQDGEVTCGFMTNMTPQKMRLPIKPLFIVPGRTRNMCAVAEDFEMFCWGEANTNVPWRVPTDFTKFIVARESMCTLSPAGVRCFGSDIDGALQVPDLRKPYDIAGSSAGACALDDEGVKCWRDNFRDSYVPYLKNIALAHPAGTRYKHVAIGDYYVYLTTDQNSVLAYHPGERKLMDLKAPYGPPFEKLAGSSTACGLRAGRVWCADNSFQTTPQVFEWTDVEDIKLIRNTLCVKRKGNVAACFHGERSIAYTFPTLSRQVSAPKIPFPPEQLYELSTACEILKYSNYDPYWNCESKDIISWPKFKDPMVAGINNTSFCVWDRTDRGLVCSNQILKSEGSGLIHIPWLEGSVRRKIIGNHFFTLERVAAHLRALARYSLPARRVFLDELAAFADRLSDSKSSRWRLLKFLEPLVKTEDSPFYVEEIEPAYTQAMKDFEFRLEGEFEAHSAEQLVIALRVMAASLKTMGEFLPPEERAAVVNALREISRATLNPDAQTVSKALVAAKFVDVTKFTAPQTEFLVQSLNLAAEWLKAELSL